MINGRATPYSVINRVNKIKSLGWKSKQKIFDIYFAGYSSERQMVASKIMR
jgi:hypothetical protein